MLKKQFNFGREFEIELNNSNFSIKERNKKI